ncbi:thiamine pyrophosphate-binding protein [Paracoccus suum]|uniref:Thiamine pyrophosphate-binding protein n=1 Tax=Paracoccus suum TaxID=2259340 RepID=A0A344PMD0_9RHOB|nr:thiamine pyrophosphate-binding protein [Paracoccus suum]AXC50535.1 thiamine pyrophosphate-binding protein [Paracoccus suum]
MTGTDVVYGSDLMAELLRSMGVRHAFINPGSSFRGLHDSIVNCLDDRDPKLVLTTHEMIAVSMAHGYAKASGEPGVAILHNLVGLLNGSMGVFNAFCDQVPLLILGGSGPADPAERRFIDWAHCASTQPDIVRPFVKWAEEPATLQACLDAMLEARRRSVTAPRGPVYVSLDAGLQESPADADVVLPDPSLPRFAAPAPSVPDPATLTRIAEVLAAARLPLIIGGRFGTDPATTAALAPLVELTGAAYLDDRNIVCMPTAHPQNMEGDGAIRGEADVILALDCQDLTAATLGYGSNRSAILSGSGAVGRAAPYIIDISRNDQFGGSWARFGGPTPPADLRVDADALASLGPLLAAVEAAMTEGRRVNSQARIETLKARKAEVAARRRHRREAGNNETVSLAKLTEALFAEVRGDDWLLAVRNHRSWQAGIWDFPGSGYYLGGDGGGGVGYGPGAVAGAALALKDSGKLVIGILGDGDFVMGGGALWSAAHTGAPMLIVIANNRSWGNDELHQIEVAQHRGRPVGNAHVGQRMEDPPIDLLAMARSMGASGFGPATNPAELAVALAEGAAAARAGKVAVVEVMTAVE